jgi:hypothetical protein
METLNRFNEEIFWGAAIIIIIVSTVLLVSAIIVTYAAFTGKIHNETGNLFRWNDNVSYYLIMSGFLGYVIALTFLLNEVLFFIPESWGDYDSDGYFTSHKWMISWWISIVITIFIFFKYKTTITYLSEKYNQVKKNKNLLPAIVLAAGLIIASIIYAFGQRYQLEHGYRIDKWTGTEQKLELIK